MERREIEQLVIGIRQKLTLYMNGSAAEEMRRHGICYRLNYGAALPDLKRLASEYKPDCELAQELWKQECRECRMLAAMLQPAESYTPDLADLWMESIEYSDLAEVCSRYLFPFMPEASSVAFRWIACQDPMAQYCGFLTIANLMRSGREMRECCVMELKDQAQAALAGDELLPRQGAAAAMDVYRQVHGDR